MTELEARNLSLSRGGAPILSGVAFAAAGGGFVGLVGPNGAGKSTLLRCLAGLERDAQGERLLDGLAISSLTHRERARRIAYLPQLREVHWSVDVATVVALGRFAYGAPQRLQGPDRAAVERAMSETDIAHLRARAATTLSGGEGARMHLARALCSEAPLLLADEPAAALDPRHQLSVMKILQKKARRGGLVLAALHDLDLAARFCTRIVMLDQGRLVADGAPSAALADETIARVFGVAARRVAIDGETFLRLTAQTH